jgi:hypothetical protein
MSFVLGNEHILNQLENNFFSNAMDITSFLNDGIVFSRGNELPNKEWKEQWIKYFRMIMPYSGYRVEYSNPYKSDKHKNITEYEIYKGDKLIDGDQTWSLENAEAQAYIKISQLSTFGNLYKNEVEKVKWIIAKISFYSDINDRHYRVSRDLEKIINNKTLLRKWKLSLLEI